MFLCPSTESPGKTSRLVTLGLLPALPRVLNITEDKSQTKPQGLPLVYDHHLKWALSPALKSHICPPVPAPSPYAQLRSRLLSRPESKISPPFFTRSSNPAMSVPIPSASPFLQINKVSPIPFGTTKSTASSICKILTYNSPLPPAPLIFNPSSGAFPPGLEHAVQFLT